MGKIIDINALLHNLGAKNIDDLEKVINISAPSMVEYLIRQLSDDKKYTSDLNLSNVEKTINIGEIDIHFDYEKNCHIIDNYKKDDTLNLDF
ncbi:hypothetical protein CP985_10920 [Malaciobacter mytili LMG 24559]|uniref:Uncharacterized protein n=1 Tax=Malaciobacter mytili LMG 24559 TaxID=1032238 RepID=A0AAX2AEB8_9BACT|nr:hypothetical protein [Malaciobacter mytili]AXH16309.1 hypothetical protein AMYT_a0009 [Malaciobacter mytili LMG 24559]RXK14975.1 hypothetical protein CP985_10920 [Malaciobacter mytili LMG 24559]